jgi:hypothetical protein
MSITGAGKALPVELIFFSRFRVDEKLQKRTRGEAFKSRTTGNFRVSIQSASVLKGKKGQI